MLRVNHDPSIRFVETSLQANVTHLTPFPLNSSARANPLARISRLENVEAALMPDGKPVTFLTRRSLIDEDKDQPRQFTQAKDRGAHREVKLGMGSKEGKEEEDTHPAGPSCMHILGIPNRWTALVSPTHLEVNCPLPMRMPSFSSSVNWATVAFARVYASVHDSRSGPFQGNKRLERAGYMR